MGGTRLRAGRQKFIKVFLEFYKEAIDEKGFVSKFSSCVDGWFF